MTLGFLEILVLIGATARLTRLGTQDKLTEPARASLLRRWPSSVTAFGDSEVEHDMLIGTDQPMIRDPEDGWWYAEYPTWIGYLIECSWCQAVWWAAVSLALWQFPVWQWIATGLAISYVAGFVIAAEPE